MIETKTCHPSLPPDHWCGPAYEQRSRETTPDQATPARSRWQDRFDGATVASLLVIVVGGAFLYLPAAREAANLQAAHAAQSAATYPVWGQTGRQASFFDVSDGQGGGTRYVRISVTQVDEATARAIQRQQEAAKLQQELAIKELKAKLAAKPKPAASASPLPLPAEQVQPTTSGGWRRFLPW